MTEATYNAALAIVGQRVRTISTYSQPAATTKVVDIHVNNLGGILYIMENGSWLTANEFNVR